MLTTNMTSYMVEIQKVKYFSKVNIWWLKMQSKFVTDLFHNEVKRGKMKLTWNLIGSRFFASQSNSM